MERGGCPAGGRAARLRPGRSPPGRRIPSVERGVKTWRPGARLGRDSVNIAACVAQSSRLSTVRVPRQARDSFFFLVQKQLARAPEGGRTCSCLSSAPVLLPFNRFPLCPFSVKLGRRARPLQAISQPDQRSRFFIFKIAPRLECRHSPPPSSLSRFPWHLSCSKSRRARGSESGPAGPAAASGVGSARAEGPEEVTQVTSLPRERHLRSHQNMPSSG